jgi:hypothetical protein
MFMSLGVITGVVRLRNSFTGSLLLSGKLPDVIDDLHGAEMRTAH